MVTAIIIAMIVSASVLIGTYAVLADESKMWQEWKGFVIVGYVAAFILAMVITTAPLWLSSLVKAKVDGMAIDLDNCRYVGAEVYTADDDRTVFIDITSGDGVLYAYDGQVDATAQYMLTIDAKTGEVLVVWQNVD